MSFKGGAIDFKDDVVSKSKDVIQEILTDKDTSIKLLTQNPVTPAYLFTIKFNNDKFSKYFKKLSSTTIPNVLLLKLMAYEFLSYSSTTQIIDNNQFTNEIKQHIHLNNSDKMFPICPSFLYSERISYPGGKYSLTGACINDLLSKFNLYSKITQTMVEKLKRCLIDRKRSLGDSTGTQDISIEGVSQHIIIMEYYSCITLKKFIRDRHYDDILSNYYIYGIELPPMDLEEFSCVLTFFMTLIMLESGFIHGDMHENNILLCVDDKLNIDPVVIDFSRTSRLKFENKFDTENLVRLMNIIEIVENKKSKKEKLENLKLDRYLLNSYLLNPYFREIYNKTIKIFSPHIIPSDIILPAELINIAASTIIQAPQKSETPPPTYVTPLSTYEAPKFMEEIIKPSVITEQTEDAEIARHIENLLHTESYVEAAIVSSMCCLPSFNISIFYLFIDAHLRRQLFLYRSMYYCKSEKTETQLSIWKSYDVLLKRLLEARYLKRQSLFEAERPLTFEPNKPKPRRGVTRQVLKTFVNVLEKLSSLGRHGMGTRSISKRSKRTKRTKRSKRTKRTKRTKRIKRQK